MIFKGLSVAKNCPRPESVPLTLNSPIPDKKEKINLNFCFHHSLWCLKRFYEGLTGLHKTF